MKYLDEYRDEKVTRGLLDEIGRIVTREWKLMEVCGGQTHSILKSGLDQLLPPQIELIHGPGCPVCVTPLELIDKAIALASRPEVIFVSYGDMLRVPGSERDLFSVRAAGGDVRIVYSPLDTLKIARENPDKTIVFFGIGFETTAPANAMAVVQAKRQGIKNFAMLVSHVTVPPAISALLESPDVRVDGFLAAGHVCTIMGYWEYEPLVKKYKVPVVVTGFEPVDIVHGVLMCVKQLEVVAPKWKTHMRSVRREGNEPAQAIINEVFERVIARGAIGSSQAATNSVKPIPITTLRCASRYSNDCHKESSLHQWQVLQGLKKPNQCPAFGKECTPQMPLGATMVSSEGACAAYYRYARFVNPNNFKLQRTTSKLQTSVV